MNWYHINLPKNDGKVPKTKQLRILVERETVNNKMTIKQSKIHCFFFLAEFINTNLVELRCTRCFSKPSTRRPVAGPPAPQSAGRPGPGRCPQP